MAVKLANLTWECKNIDDALSVIKKSKYLEWDLNTLPLSLNKARMEYVRKFIADNGEVRFHLPHSFWDIGAADEKIAKNSFDYYDRLFDTISLLGMRYAVLHIGAATESEVEVSLENLAKLAVKANDCGIRLCVENLIHGLSSDMNFISQCLALPYVYMCLDTGHAECVMREKGESVFNAIKSFKDKILHAHVYHYEDENMNHIPFTVETIKGYRWFDILIDSPCEWYTMELELQNDQNVQKKIIGDYIEQYKIW